MDKKQELIWIVEKDSKKDDLDMIINTIHDRIKDLDEGAVVLNHSFDNIYNVNGPKKYIMGIARDLRTYDLTKAAYIKPTSDAPGC
ncbi:hypothetical protein COV93_03460 [Candidatus Woesearchaeota archaeon CG11_big_fil_rev_8_21_14_0_20_43_8]|nr:MAG: hypothetical protein COV93_03460 [Candidatus Woesearchaeota archaeon CG11_big_fil_rev_8_21_14_0_20_43_8]PIO05069.1 MAG: hypothetical protein COT47_06410 [Candidatus Woesearchaeota archaeon CG08_land_8_20_14_0_20_43_7]